MLIKIEISGVMMLSVIIEIPYHINIELIYQVLANYTCKRLIQASVGYTVAHPCRSVVSLRLIRGLI